MQHLLILAFLPILVVGTWAVSTARRAHQFHGAESARPLFHYLIYLNLLALIYLVAKYSFANVLQMGMQQTRLLVHAGVTLGVFVALAGKSYWLLRTALALPGRRLPRIASRLFMTGVSISGASYLAGLGILAGGGSEQWLRTSHLLVVIAMTGLCVAISVTIARSRGPNLDRVRNRAVRWLGLALLVGYCLSISALALPRPWHLVISAASLLWLNCATLHWLRSRVHHFYPATRVTDIAEALDELAVRFTITKREREVMELLFQGKSYKEIEDLLCISLGTVKNHAYNLYRKAGVSSRAQLIHLAIGNHLSAVE